MKKTLLIGILALAVTAVEVQAQAVSVSETTSVSSNEASTDALRRGPGRGGDRRGRDWDRGGDRRGRDWDRGGRNGRYWPRPGRDWDWDNDAYVCHARGNRSRMLFRGDGWSRSSARSQALNRCYRNSNGCYITSCYRD